MSDVETLETPEVTEGTFVTDFLEAVREVDVTVDEAESVREALDEAIHRANLQFIKFFEPGDVVRLENGNIGTVTRRNRLTVSVALKSGTVVQLDPAEIVDVIEPISDPNQFFYWEYYNEGGVPEVGEGETAE